MQRKLGAFELADKHEKSSEVYLAVMADAIDDPQAGLGRVAPSGTRLLDAGYAGRLLSAGFSEFWRLVAGAQLVDLLASVLLATSDGTSVVREKSHEACMVVLDLLSGKGA